MTFFFQWCIVENVTWIDPNFSPYEIVRMLSPQNSRNKNLVESSTPMKHVSHASFSTFTLLHITQSSNVSSWKDNYVIVD